MTVDLFGSRLRSKALGWLFSHPAERFYVRQMQSLLKEDATNLSRELSRLAGMGILVCQVEGQQKYYRANSGSPIYPELRGLIAKTVGAAGILKELLDPLRKKIDIAFIYGSMAQGGVTPSSDVDLLLIGRATFGDVVSALVPAHERMGREVNPTVFPTKEFRKKLSTGHHFLQNVMAGSKIFVIGDEHDLRRLAEEQLA